MEDNNNTQSTKQLISDSLRSLPSVSDILEDPAIGESRESTNYTIIVNTVRSVLQEHRLKIQQGVLNFSSHEHVLSDVTIRIKQLISLSLTSVINGTGVILHTNLGRAPIADGDMVKVTKIAQAYSNLELDLPTGVRDSRQTHVVSSITALTGAENALVVNNNAAAMLLSISATSKGKDVLVSRGEQIEIGGGFRIPDILKESGANIVEVGSTNRTRIEDFREAITPETGALLRVHPSNFTMVGFTEAPTLKELIRLGQEFEIPVLVDLGSGCLIDTSPYGLAQEPTPSDVLNAGANLVFFSGDKLLGGPQSGIVVGDDRYIQLLAKHPLARAMRIDKLSLAALELTLNHYLQLEADKKIPIWQMIGTPLDDLLSRANNYLKDLKEWWNHMASQVVYREDGTLSATMYSFLDGFPFEDPKKGNLVTINRGSSTIGGGSLPGETLETYVLEFQPRVRDGLTIGTPKVQHLADLLRIGNPSVVCRIENNKVILDVRTILEHQDELAKQALKTALKEWMTTTSPK